MIANVGIPMITVELPIMALALIPVMAIETAIYHWRLSLSWREAGWGALNANLLSTFGGIPLAWFAHAFIQFATQRGGWSLETPMQRLAAVTVRSAWIMPIHDEDNWMIPAAALSLLVPAFLVTIVVERFILRRSWTTISARRLTPSVLLANGSSYLLIAIFWGVLLVLSLSTGPG